MLHSVFWASPIGLMEVRGENLPVKIEELQRRIARAQAYVPPKPDPWVDKAYGFRRFREIDAMFRVGVGYP